MRIRHLIAFLLVVGLGATGAMAANYTVYPTVETNGTGTTTYDAKTGGTVLAWGGATTGTTRKENGYFKFDITSVPDVTVPTYVEFHFYVSATNFPWYSVTPLSLDPNQLASTAALIWDDVQAEATVGYYNYQNEGSSFIPGWKMLELGGTALTDITAAFTQDWFALGMPERDTLATYYLTVDGNTDTNIPYLVVSDDPLYDPPTGLSCVLNVDDVDLAWTNGDVYDSIDIYEDDILIDTVLGTDVAYTVVAPTSGVQHCYKVCGIVSTFEFCSDDCCVFLGSCDDALVDLGQIVCPAMLTASGDTTGAFDFCEDANGDHHYSFEVVASGLYEMSLCNATWDTRLYLYDDQCCGTQIGYDDDGCDGPGSSLASVITTTLDPGVYYLLVGGYSANEGAYDLEISCIVNPTDLTCLLNGTDVDLTWTNNAVYDSINIYEDAILIDTVLGTDVAYTVVGPASGMEHCYTVCGVLSAVEYCTEDCCVLVGSCEDVLVDLGSIGCPGSLTDTGDTTGALSYCGLTGPDNHYYFTVTDYGSYMLSLCTSAVSWDSYLRLYDDTCCSNQIAYNDDFCGSLGHGEISTVDLIPGTYYVTVDGYTDAFGAYTLTIDCLGLLAYPPTDLTCTENGADVDLAWTNNDTYDSIEVYEDDILIDTLLATDVSYTVVGVTKGSHCYRVCGIVGVDMYCSIDCCGIFGYSDHDLLWDFEADDGGFITEGTTGWQWGAPTYGPCFDTADGNVWGVNLDGDYDVNSCLLLDTPVIDLGDKGGFVCIEHCYDTELGYDGGTVWFTTNGGVDYVNLAPVEGYDDDQLSLGTCEWAYGVGIGAFTGDSLGWVTDCWELVDMDYVDNDVALRFAFGSDGSIIGTGWLIDNITIYRNMVTDPISCDYTVTPLVGTLPFATTHRMSLTNLLSGGQVWYRRIAGRISLQIGNGNFFNPWRAGFTNVQAGQTYFSQWSQNLPALGTVIGNNTFTLTAVDVTPSPYNQPPYPASGTTCVKPNVVVANAP